MAQLHNGLEGLTMAKRTPKAPTTKAKPAPLPPLTPPVTPPEALDQMEQACHVGTRWKQVALIGGIPWGTFVRRMQEGRDPASPHAELVDRLTRARASGVAMLLARLTKLAREGDTRAVTWLLERVHQYDGRGDPEAAEVGEAAQQGRSTGDKLAEALREALKP